MTSAVLADACPSQPGQEFADLLLVGATSVHCPFALLSIATPAGWSTLAFGAEREMLDDSELFDIVAQRRVPIEVTDPAKNPALSRGCLATSGVGVRWLLAVPLTVRESDKVAAVFAVLDTQPRELSKRETFAMNAVRRLVSAALSSSDLAAEPRPLHVERQSPQALGAASHVVDGFGLLHTRDVAALFDVSERTVMNWAKSGQLPYFRTVGGHLRFRQEDILALLEARSSGPAAQP